MNTRPVPHVFVIFGATGDLAKRKLFPGLYRLAAAGRLPDDYSIIGAGRRSPGPDDEFRTRIGKQLDEFVDDVDPTVVQKLLRKTRFEAVDGDYDALADAIRHAHHRLGASTRTLVYLSVPPNATKKVIAELHASGITEEARLVIEKPFGTDLVTSRELDATVADAISEDRVFRIDHFLGKEAVQNIFAMRFANGLIEPAWTRQHLESVQIDVPETLTVDGRGSFYDATGCFRDMITTHLCQVMGFIAMEPPVHLDERSLRNEKAKVFAALQPLDPARVVFGQYRGYRDVDGVDAASTVETFVALEARIESERWQGVPFYMRTGKALAQTRRTVTLTFRTPPRGRFGGSDYGPNQLVFDLGDSPRLDVSVTVKRPGPDMALMPLPIHLDFAEADPEDTPLEAYERLLLDVMRGDQTLFTRADEVDRLWQVCQPVLDAPPPIHQYDRGSWGPSDALNLPGAGGWYLGD